MAASAEPWLPRLSRGIATAAITPRITTTMTTSIRLKPRPRRGAARGAGRRPWMETVTSLVSAARRRCRHAGRAAVAKNPGKRTNYRPASEIVRDIVVASEIRRARTAPVPPPADADGSAGPPRPHVPPPLVPSGVDVRHHVDGIELFWGRTPSGRFHLNPPPRAPVGKQLDTQLPPVARTTRAHGFTPLQRTPSASPSHV